MSTHAPSGLRADAEPADAELVECARLHGTPLYRYDLARLRATVGEIRAALADVGARLFFATMANDRSPVLRELAALGVGACVNSTPHLDLARRAGFVERDIQFTSTGISAPDLGTLARTGVRTNLDSLVQLDAWFGFGPREAGVRVNAASLLGATDGDRIGIDADSLPAAVQLAESRGARIAGLHVYVGTNFQAVQDMLPTLEAFFDLAATVPTLRYVNVGGGIGVNYGHEGPGFDLHGYGARLAELAARLRERVAGPVEVVCEPGRAMTASSATFLTTVTDVKWLADRRIAAVDGSIAIFPRPLLHPESPHRIRELAAHVEPGAPRCPTHVVGRTTYSRDILGITELSADLAPGALLAFDDAGSYCQSMASRFLGQPDPREIFVG